jgi:kynurenine formamidase
MRNLPAAELFKSDNYNIIDISHTVTPNKEIGRPFTIERSLLDDNSYKYDIKTHSHVGTHVEGGRHFYGKMSDNNLTQTITGNQDNRAIIDYPLESFYGPGVLMPISEPEITSGVCEDLIGDVLQAGDVVVVRNETSTTLAKKDAYSVNNPTVPTMTEDGARWLSDFKIKTLVFADISMGRTIENSNIIHDIFMSKGITFLEFVENLNLINKTRFSIMFLPFKVDKLGSSFCRAIVIEDAL